VRHSTHRPIFRNARYRTALFNDARRRHGDPPARWKCHVTKVLYIEHDDDNLYMLKMRLERVGDFEVLASDSSEQGCKLALTERPDVILMDLEMPDADCWEVVRRLKKDAQTGHIPIIGMSAYALDSEREKAIATGCDEFDAKPIDFDALVAAIRRLVANPK
jgi:two-component system cell cycle response regulator DivK